MAICSVCWRDIDDMEARLRTDFDTLKVRVLVQEEPNIKNRVCKDIYLTREFIEDHSFPLIKAAVMEIVDEALRTRLIHDQDTED